VNLRPYFVSKTLLVNDLVSCIVDINDFRWVLTGLLSGFKNKDSRFRYNYTAGIFLSAEY